MVLNTDIPTKTSISSYVIFTNHRLVFHLHFWYLHLSHRKIATTPHNPPPDHLEPPQMNATPKQLNILSSSFNLLQRHTNKSAQHKINTVSIRPNIRLLVTLALSSIILYVLDRTTDINSLF